MTVYHGGKSRHGKEIADVIKTIYDQQDEKKIHGYVEPFCGMCGVFKHVVSLLPHNLEYMASDQHESLIIMWKALQNGWIPPKNCSVNRYNKLKCASPSAEKAYVGFSLGYGGQFFSGQHRKLYNGRLVDKVDNMCKLGRSVLNHVKFSRQSYEKYDNIYGYIIYCDPPYSNVNSSYYRDGKNSKTLIKFDSTKFWSWCRKMSKHNIVIVSEFSAPPDFKSVHTFNSKRNAHINANTKCEHLFMYEKYFKYFTNSIYYTNI